jgi:hypothetical protein
MAEARGVEVNRLLPRFADELVKLGERLGRVQVAPRDRPKLGPAFKRLRPQEQKTELAAPGSYTHRAAPPDPSGQSPNAPLGWTRKEMAGLRTGQHSLAKAQAKPRPLVVKR